MILGQYRTLASFKCVAPTLAFHLRQMPKIVGDVAQRFSSKCASGSDGKGKKSKKGGGADKGKKSKKGGKVKKSACGGGSDGKGKKKDGKDNLSAVLHAIEDLRLEQTPIPEALPGLHTLWWHMHSYRHGRGGHKVSSNGSAYTGGGSEGCLPLLQ
uniref:Uncharacterized protein n=2 Tax=Bactrocera dorsalis TaxID=27457 RepID=A0A034VLX8_BACDO